MEFWSFVCSLLVFFNLTILIRSQSQPICLTGDKAKEFNDQFVEEHNKYRSCHGVPPLVADDALIQDSIEWSKHLVFINDLEHSTSDTRKGAGENLASTSTSGGVIDVPKWNFIEDWYEEIKDYHGSFTHGTGHYTQVVWKASQKVGCGVCLTASSTSVFATCRYLPGGNVVGQFEENVPPRRSNCEDGGNTSNQPSDSKKRNSVTKDKNLPTVSGKPISKTTPTENPDNPTSNSKHTETTSSSHKTTTVNSNTSWDTEKTLVFITISTHAILGLVVVITLSVVVYYYAISYYHL